MPHADWGTLASRGQAPVILTGVDAVLSDIEDTIHEATDLRDPWEILGTKWVVRQVQAFADGQGTWMPLQSETLRKKAKAGRGTEKLIDRGYMLAGLTDLRPRFAARMFAAYGPRKHDARVMNPATLSAVGTRHQPKRVPVPRMSTSEKATWFRVVEDHVHEQIGKRR